jgi:hypothetical protein
MENLKIMRTVTSDDRPSFNDWAKELKVSSGYHVIGQREIKLPQIYKPKTYKPKTESFWERMNRFITKEQ